MANRCLVLSVCICVYLWFNSGLLTTDFTDGTDKNQPISDFRIGGWSYLCYRCNGLQTYEAPTNCAKLPQNTVYLRARQRHPRLVIVSA